MKKDDLKNLRLDASLKMSVRLTDYIQNFTDIIDDLEEFYQCKFEELPEATILDCISAYLHENLEIDLIDDLSNEGDLEIDVWNPELF